MRENEACRHQLNEMRVEVGSLRRGVKEGELLAAEAARLKSLLVSREEELRGIQAEGPRANLKSALLLAEKRVDGAEQQSVSLMQENRKLKSDLSDLQKRYDQAQKNARQVMSQLQAEQSRESD